MTFFSFLPVTEDKEESSNTYRMACELIERHSSGIFGDNLENLPHILNVFGLVLGTDLIDEETTTKMVTIIKHFASNNQEAFNQIVSMAQDPKIKGKLICFCVLDSDLDLL